MLNQSGRRDRRSRSKTGASLLAVMFLATVLSVVGASPASAAGKVVDLGGNVSFEDGSPAVGVKVDLFEAATPWNRAAWIAPAFADSNGNYVFPVQEDSCYILVGIATLGSSFGSAGSGQMYDQRYACSGPDGRTDVDFKLYREAVKPPPTTAPPTTVPPTTAPPTTAPPTTAPPTTAPPTTAPPTTVPPPVTPPPACAFMARAGYLFIYNGSGATSFGILGGGPGSTQMVDIADIIGSGSDLIGSYVYWAGVTFNSVEISVVAKSDSPKGTDSKPVPCRRGSSPIALDTNLSGAVERVPAEVQFDFAGNGDVATVDEWFAPTEGILFDASVAGPVTGEHLFGDQDGLYSDGFEKLALLDANADGQVAGAELDGLAIWTDMNTNGVLDAGEQSNLADHGVVSLSTSHSNMVSSAALVDGGTMLTEDLWFPQTEAAGTTNTTSLVLLGLGGLSLLGYAVIVSRRRRDGLDAELQELLNQQDSVR